MHVVKVVSLFDGGQNLELCEGGARRKGTSSENFTWTHSHPSITQQRHKTLSQHMQTAIKMHEMLLSHESSTTHTYREVMLIHRASSRAKQRLPPPKK